MSQPQKTIDRARFKIDLVNESGLLAVSAVEYVAFREWDDPPPADGERAPHRTERIAGTVALPDALLVQIARIAEQALGKVA